MKLVLSIASNNDIPKIISELAKEGYFTTRLSTTGQFLADGHTLIMSGTEDEKVDDLIAIVKENVTKRTVDISGVESTLEGTLLKKPHEYFVQHSQAQPYLSYCSPSFH